MKVILTILLLFVIGSNNFASENQSDQIDIDEMPEYYQPARVPGPLLPQDDLSLLLSSNYSLEMMFLLGQLRTKEIESQHGITFIDPDRYFLEGVAQRLTTISRQSPEERAMVIKALSEIVDDPHAQREGFFASRWHWAVYLLAKMKAAEASDVLVRNIHVTGQTVIVSLNHRPVLSAVIDIGRPAVPWLIQGLSDNDNFIRRDSVYALSEIGGREAKQALEEALKKETDEDARKAITSALTTIAYSNLRED